MEAHVSSRDCAEVGIEGTVLVCFVLFFIFLFPQQEND